MVESKPFVCIFLSNTLIFDSFSIEIYNFFKFFQYWRIIKINLRSLSAYHRTSFYQAPTRWGNFAPVLFSEYWRTRSVSHFKNIGLYRVSFRGGWEATGLCGIVLSRHAYARELMRYCLRPCHISNTVFVHREALLDILSIDFICITNI